MTFNQADSLFVKIVLFLEECGGPYTNMNQHMQENVIQALATGQFVIGITTKGIQYFVSYWRILPEDLEGLKEGLIPISRTTGNSIYINNFGNKGGRGAFTEIINKLKKSFLVWDGVYWHRYKKGWQSFPNYMGDRLCCTEDIQ